MHLGQQTLPPRSSELPSGKPDGRSESVPSNTPEAESTTSTEPACVDRELVRRFLRERDQTAFQQLVERHGALVLGVISRVLRDRHLAEDAFQATFLVLARKAATIRKKSSLASWLHGVARRIALRTLQQQYRRGEESLQTEPIMEASPLESVGSQWEQQVLDEELQQLPEAWRDPLILHELEGLSCQAAADRLGLTLTALEGRLKRGRKELKHRLLRRGIGAGAVLMTMQAAHAAACQPAADLILATVQSGLQAATSAASAASATDSLTTPQHLASQELIAMTTVKTSTLITAAGSLVVAAAVVGGWDMIGSANASGPSQSVAIALLAGADEAESSVDGVATEVAGVVDFHRTATAEQNITEALRREVEVEFIDTELSQVVGFMSERYGIPILMDAAALAEQGVGTDTPVNLILSGISMESALNRILREQALDYVVRDEVLEITTREAAEEFMETHVYQLRELPAEFKPEDVARVICRTIRPGSWGENPWVYIVPTPQLEGDLYGGGGEYGSGGGYGDASGLSSSGYPGDSASMMGMSGGSKPVPEGKTLAAIETLPGCLIITHCQRAHREIAELLDQLHRMPAAQPSPQPANHPVPRYEPYYPPDYVPPRTGPAPVPGSTIPPGRPATGVHDPDPA